MSGRSHAERRPRPGGPGLDRGREPTPAASPPPVIARDALVGVTVDELGVPYLMRLRMGNGA